jgi:hypothetical protein
VEPGHHRISLTDESTERILTTVDAFYW